MADIAVIAFPIVAKTAVKGGLVIEGLATDGSLDSDRQILDPEWSVQALRQWADTGGNIRLQHSNRPVGRAISVDGHRVKALIVSKKAIRLIKAGVLRAFSVGVSRPVLHRDFRAPGGRIAGGDIVELSIVDRPANTNCVFQIAKSAGGQWTYTGVFYQKGESMKGKKARARLRKAMAAGVVKGQRRWAPVVLPAVMIPSRDHPDPVMREIWFNGYGSRG